MMNLNNHHNRQLKMLKSPIQPNGIEPEGIKKVNALVTKMTPMMMALIAELKLLGMHELEVMVGDGTDKMKWSRGLVPQKSPSQEQLTIEITHILDRMSPGKSSTFMGMIWSDNSIIATKIAETVAEFRKRDREEVGQQIVKLLAEFKKET